MDLGASFQRIDGFLTEGIAKYSLQVAGGLIILVISWILSQFVAGIVQRALVKRHIDITIIKFLTQAVRVGILALGALMMLSSFGVQIAPLVAGLSVAGVGVGLALQGPLSNYAAGATLIFTKPFRIGDIIEVKEYQGEVRDISLPRTELLGLDGSRIVIPNKHIIGEVIKNFSEYRKLEINVSVSYDSDIKRVLTVVEGIIKTEPRIPNKEVYKVGIKEFAESSVNIQAFVWVPQEKYVDVKFAVNKAILEQFRGQGIDIPYPQRQVHLVQKPV